MLINKCGRFYTIKKNETETTKQLIERGWFIVNSLHLDTTTKKNKEQMEESEKLSRLWFNINVLECKYSEDLEKKIQNIEDKIFV
jgi:hypothetical protein